MTPPTLARQLLDDSPSPGELAGVVSWESLDQRSTDTFALWELGRVAASM